LTLVVVVVNLPYRQPGTKSMATEDATTHLLRDILSQLTDVRERLIRLETHGYHERLTKVEDAVDMLRDRLTILETQGRFFSAGVSAGVAIVVSLVGAAFTFMISR
jgi:hypothetical protein